jgi:hypothetical protein
MDGRIGRYVVEGLFSEELTPVLTYRVEVRYR